MDAVSLLIDGLENAVAAEAFARFHGLPSLDSWSGTRRFWREMLEAAFREKSRCKPC